MVPKVIIKGRESFGERALLYDKGRAGTCIAYEDTHLAVVTKGSYQRFLMKIVQAEERAMI